MQTATATIEDLESRLETQHREIADVDRHIADVEQKRIIALSKARDSRRTDAAQQIEAAEHAAREAEPLRARRRELDLAVYLEREQLEALHRDRTLHAALGGRELPTAVVLSDRVALAKEHRVRLQRFADAFRDAAVAYEAVRVLDAALDDHGISSVMQLAPPVALSVVNERSLFREWIAAALLTRIIK